MRPMSLRRKPAAQSGSAPGRHQMNDEAGGGQAGSRQRDAGPGPACGNSPAERSDCAAQEDERHEHGVQAVAKIGLQRIDPRLVGEQHRAIADVDQDDAADQRPQRALRLGDEDEREDQDRGAGADHEADAEPVGDATHDRRDEYAHHADEPEHPHHVRAEVIGRPRQQEGERGPDGAECAECQKAGGARSAQYGLIPNSRHNDRNNCGYEMSVVGLVSGRKRQTIASSRTLRRMASANTERHPANSPTKPLSVRPSSTPADMPLSRMPTVRPRVCGAARPATVGMMICGVIVVSPATRVATANRVKFGASAHAARPIVFAASRHRIRRRGSMRIAERDEQKQPERIADLAQRHDLTGDIVAGAEGRADQGQERLVVVEGRNGEGAGDRHDLDLNRRQAVRVAWFRLAGHGPAFTRIDQENGRLARSDAAVAALECVSHECMSQ